MGTNVSNSHSKTQLLNATTENITLAIRALQSGDVIGFPTETVYGLAGNALNDEAIAKIFLYKSRPSFDPLIVHVAETLQSCTALAEAEIIDLKSMTQDQISTCDQLIQVFWPGPLTLIFPKHERVSDLVTSSLPTVALRAPAHLVAQKILRQSGLPLAAPSANQFGRISPTKSQHVLEELGGQLKYCLEGGECQIGVESTIASVNTRGEVSVLRPGGVSLDVLEKHLGKLFLGLHTELGLPAVAAKSPVAPGLLESHYAPRKPMLRIQNTWNETELINLYRSMNQLHSKVRKVSILSSFPLAFETQKLIRNVFTQADFYSLSEEENDSLTAARNLFTQLRMLDQSDSDLIVCELPKSQKGLWPAIRDRLTRASKKWSAT
jgi:L-threonylcarbamoyladenylate synthase